MRFKFSLILVFILSISFSNMFAESPLVDSLLNELTIAKHDTTKIKIYNQLSGIYTKIEPDAAFTYVKKAFELSERLTNSDDEDIVFFVKKSNADSYTYLGNYYKALSDNYSALENYKLSIEILREIDDKKALANNYTDIGIIKYLSGDYIVTEEYYNMAVEIHKQLNDEQGLAKVYRNLGNLFLKQGDYPLSIEYYQNSLEISEKLNDLRSASRCYNNIGYIYTETQRYSWAIDYLKNSLKIKERIGDERGIATALNNIGNVYLKKKEYDTALIYLSKSLSIRREVKAIRHEAISLQNIGRVYFAQKKYDIAEEFLQNALRIYKMVEESEKIGTIYTELASLKIKENKFNEAIKFADSSLIIALDLNALPMQRDCYNLLAESYENKHNHSKAYEFLKQYTTVKDSISEQLATKLIVSYTRYKIGKKEKEIEAQKLKIETQDVRAKNQEMKMYFSLSALLVMIVLAIVFYRNFKQKIRANNLLRRQKSEIEDQKEEIEKQRDVVVEQNRIVLEQKKEITDSIIYAKNIQRAVMPSEEFLKNLLPEYFLMFRPKDIVSGDFYWIKKIKNFIVIAVADCTGHGVPGAFMSMLGVSFLNEIVNKLGSMHANLILNELRDNVKKSLRQTGKENEAKDGMDIALCIIDYDNMQLEYSGAFNSLFLIRDNELIKYEADRMPIGIYIREKESFTNHIVDLKKGDNFYIFSDGYVDQFGGNRGSKMMVKRFRQLLMDNHQKSALEQKAVLEDFIDEWQSHTDEKGQTYKQIDDILVIGMKV